MATMWHIRISPPTDVSDTNPVNVADVVLAEVDAMRTELQDRANGSVRVERLVSAHRNPLPWPDSDTESPSRRDQADWFVTVETDRESGPVVEEYLRFAADSLERALGEDAYVELIRTADARSTYLGEMAAGHRVVIGLPTDRPVSDLPKVREFVGAAAEWLAGAIEIRELGKVRVEWSSLSGGDSTLTSADSSPRATGAVKVAEIVVDRDAAAMEKENGEYRGWVHALCQHVACAPGTVPWTASVHRFVVEAPSPNDAFNFWNGYPGQGP